MADCLKCSGKSCKTAGVDCFSLHDKSLESYRGEGEKQIVQSSSKLVDGGRAGQLSRFEELIEFCQIQAYGKIGLAYCFGLETVAEKVRFLMEKAGLRIIPARCTMGGVREKEIDESKDTQAISCNPAGQARFLNERADFVIELGLCLGHDVLFHKELEVPFTVLLVKDRVHNHNPLAGIENLGE